eukprot:scaffold5816_cov57-Phaeocystis_antarctica.AAC.9
MASRFRVRVRAGRSSAWASARKAAAPPTIIRSDTPMPLVSLMSPHSSPDGTTTACGRRASASAAGGGIAMKSVSRRTRAYVTYERLPREVGGRREGGEREYEGGATSLRPEAASVHACHEAQARLAVEQLVDEARIARHAAHVRTAPHARAAAVDSGGVLMRAVQLPGGCLDSEA